MVEINLKFDDSLPPEHHDMAERSLRTAIAFLDDQPRPMELPAIEYFTPDWSRMQFTVGVDAVPHGLFNRETMSGWCVLTVRLNGDMLLMTDPLTTILNVDLELATTVAMVSILDGYYYDGIHFDRQLHRQLQYLDSVAASNKTARSLLDDFEQAQEDQAEKERMERYWRQYPEKRKLRQARQAEAWRIKDVPWYDNKYPKPYTGEAK